jgi:hypothetical protein
MIYGILKYGVELWENSVMEGKTEKTIDEIFREGTLIDEALKKGVQEALIRHKQAGNPVVVWRDGKTVWLQPEEILTDF